MRIQIIFAFSITACFCPDRLQAQSVPIGALPTYYNGGFAGEAGALRVATFSFLNYSRNTSGSSASWTDAGSLISVDHFLKKIGSGVAFTAGQQDISQRFRGTSISLAISPKFSFKGKYTFAPFADFSFGRYNFRNEGIVNSQNYISNYYDMNSFRIKTGFLVNSDKAYVGVSAHVLQYLATTTPSYPFHDRLRFLSGMRYDLQAGYTFQRLPESKFSFTPQLAVSYQRVNSQNPQTQVTKKLHYVTLLDLNLMFRYNRFISGFNSNGFVLGYQSSKFKLQVTNFYRSSVSYGKTLTLSDNIYFQTKSNASGPNIYSGSISLRYIFKKNPSVKMSGF